MYARMCVEINLNAPLLPAYTIDGNPLKIEYEGLHLICFKCGRFGHMENHCPRGAAQGIGGVPPPSGTSPAAGVPQGKTPAENSGIYGGWMVAQDPRRGRKGPAKESTKKDTRQPEKGPNLTGASRFAVLEVSGDVDEVQEAPANPRHPLANISNVTPLTPKSGRKKGQAKAKAANTGPESEHMETSKGSQVQCRVTLLGNDKMGDQRCTLRSKAKEVWMWRWPIVKT